MGASGQMSILSIAAAAAALGPTLTVISNLGTVIKATHAAILFTSGWAKYLWMMRASILSGLVPSLTAASASVWAFTTALLANPITWVVASVAAFAGAAYLVYKNWEPVKAFFIETWEGLKTAVGSALAWVGEHLAWTPLGMLVNNWGPITDFFSGLWDGIVGVFAAAWEKIKPIVDSVSGFFSSDSEVSVTGKAGGAGMFGPSLSTFLGAESALPGARGAAGAAGTARVEVDFKNLPAGARVRPDRNNTAELDLSWGAPIMTP